MPLFSVISVVQILFPPDWISAHFTRPVEIKLILNLLLNFMHRLFESDVHSFFFANRVLSPSLPSGPLLKAPNLGFLLVLKHNRGFHQSIMLQSLVFFYAPHQLMHVLRRLHGQEVPQLGMKRQPQFESARGHMFIVSLYLIIQLSIPIRIGPKSFPTPHSHRQQCVDKLQFSAASYNLGSKGLDELEKAVDGSLLQAIEPSHCYEAKTRKEHLAQQPIVPRIESHKLGKMAYVLNQIYLTVVTSERRVSEVPRLLDAFYFLKKSDRAILLNA